MKNRKNASGLRAQNMETYKELNRVLGLMGHPIHDDLGKFSSLEPSDQMAVIAYRCAVDLAASTKASMEKYVALKEDFEMVLQKEMPDKNALVELGIILHTDPMARARKGGTALAIGKFIVVNMNKIDLIFDV